MKLTQELKNQIDNLSYEALLSRWRFSISGDIIFQGESGLYFKEVLFKKKPLNHSEISKKIGF